MDDHDPTRFPVLKASELKTRDPEQQWLIEGLWGVEDVGILAGQPKSCKSVLALHMAVSITSKHPCLGRFEATRQGRVLLYAAEDPDHVVRQRLDGICCHAGLNLAELDLWTITAPTVRLDLEPHRQRLFATVAELEPTLLILDPFVRLHRIDELCDVAHNSSHAASPIMLRIDDLVCHSQPLALDGVT